MALPSALSGRFTSEFSNFACQPSSGGRSSGLANLPRLVFQSFRAASNTFSGEVGPLLSSPRLRWFWAAVGPISLRMWMTSLSTEVASAASVGQHWAPIKSANSASVWLVSVVGASLVNPGGMSVLTPFTPLIRFFPASSKLTYAVPGTFGFLYFGPVNLMSLCSKTSAFLQA